MSISVSIDFMQLKSAVAQCDVEEKMELLRLLENETFPNCMKRDGVCNPVTHVLKAIEVFKRFGRGYKPRPASEVNHEYFCLDSFYAT